MRETEKETPADSRLRAEQARRLKRLREMMGFQLQDAAEKAGLSRFAYARMEDGSRRIDTVALAKFCRARDLPAEYVVSGSLSGLPPELQRDLVAAEVAETAREEYRNGSQSEPAPSGIARRKSKAHSDT